MKKYDYDILLIDPPLEYIEDKTAQFGNLFMPSGLTYKVFNPGLLSIGTYLDWKGYSVRIDHILSINDIEKQLKKTLQSGKPRIIGISGTFGLAYRAVLKIAKLAKQVYPDVLIEVGGHHIGLMGGVVLDECKEIDVVVRYEGEIPIMELLEYQDGKRSISEISGIVFRCSMLEKEGGHINSEYIAPFKTKVFKNNSFCEDVVYDDIIENTQRSEVIDINDMPFVKYDLYPNFLTYPPYVEESRGCYGSCEYCTNYSINGKKYRKKESERFIEELKYAIGIYGKDREYPLLASIFGVDVKNTINICEGIKKNFNSIKWFSESRVDANWEEYIDLMYESGCNLFGIGMETASPEILGLMGKTKKPEYYIEKTEKFISHVKKYNNAILHLHLMFYAGETPETVKSTLKFITKWIDYIDSAHYSPLFDFPGTKLWNNFNFYNEKYGSTIIKNSLWDSLHFYPVNPSKYFSYEEAGYYTRVIEKLLMNKQEQVSVLLEARISKDEREKIDGDFKQKFLDEYLYSK
ncbi:radical SAM superfamily enzyme YgiQ (UPF0313 family) [Anaerobacterium chartisolvens]|uniref:Radical SAM superfamily enzyme YgiQ (UPF0313 family) n=1 Tax=Anaerobacterium chartisolvens TaxID=1297424 RepID=A0A369BMW1_9FIRM|nr:radical SAM protein [Anaerobacterium chartisolvens]RCX21014.1 radical SAM superfamily enzyme YgiQ (UPF0313 family) [Anaerobacterium chartisolvens]